MLFASVRALAVYLMTPQKEIGGVQVEIVRQPMFNRYPVLFTS
jgi:hypothetical protein